MKKKYCCTTTRRLIMFIPGTRKLTGGSPLQSLWCDRCVDSCHARQSQRLKRVERLSRETASVVKRCEEDKHSECGGNDLLSRIQTSLYDKK